MSARNSILCPAALVCFLSAFSPSAATITVAKSGANFTTVSAAISASKPGDVIKIMDTAVYEEMVTIDSTKCPLTLTSKNPTSLLKPVIKFQDKIHVGPRSADESKIDSLINYDQNGALCIIKAHNIIIDGIAVDGGGVHPFGYPAIWEGRYSLQHGNAAVCIWASSDVIVRNCDIRGGYFGFAIKDRNLNGIFANPNPADLDTMNTVPLVGMGQTGNHLIERNRVHNNSWGFYTESAWDLGSTIRYNLIYENHHPSDSIATIVKGLTPDEGINQSGGAFFFKDVQVSPWAIHNNTLRHNFLIFAGHWQAGYQHLIFNNIFGAPNKYWADTTPPVFPGGSTMELTPALLNRVNSCIYSAQSQAPVPEYVVIMNNLPQVEGSGGKMPEPGIILTGKSTGSGFPSSAENRWLEMTDSLFLSVDPSVAGFLEPDWNKQYVKDFIANKGWEESGVKNTDGSRADLGAIEHVHGTPSFIGTIKPAMSILAGSAQGTINFALNGREGTALTDPEIKLFRMVKVSYKRDTFGNSDKTIVIGANQITGLTPPTTPSVKAGPNSYDISVSFGTNTYAFIEIIIEATGADGRKFTSAVGFLPFRKIDYSVKVEVLDKTGKVLGEVRTGDTVQLRVTPIGFTPEFIKPLNPFGVTLQSGFKLLTPGANGLTPLEYPSGIPGGPDTKPVVFTKIPEGGFESILAAGLTKNPSGTGGSYSYLGGTTIKVFSDPTAIGYGRRQVAVNSGDRPLNEVTVKCFDLQGRKIFQKTFSAHDNRFRSPRYFLKQMPGLSTSVYFLDITIKDNASLKQSRTIQKIVVRDGAGIRISGIHRFARRALHRDGSRTVPA
jgi:hypothetical protein